MSVQALTPDFYSYVWTPLTSVVVDGSFLRLTWADGVTYDAYDLWLRENAVDAGGVDLATREGIMDPAHHVDGGAVEAACITAEGALVVTWKPTATAATYHPGWLRHVADGNHLPASFVPDPVAWTADIGEPPTYDGANVLSDAEVFRGWASDLMRYGIARLRNAPVDEDFLFSLASKVGPVRDTNFGPIWDVKADVQLAGSDLTNSTANTNLRLPPHTDLPSRETPPGFQFLHCIVNDAKGGNSTMADGAAVAAHIAEHQPEHYEALTTLNWVFFNRGPNIDHRWSGPMIDLGVPGAPLTFRAFHPVRAFPDMAQADMPRAYAAMKHFSTVAADPQFRLSYPFVPGDVVGFDNRRILHGRDAFASGGARHLRGIYIDHDEVRSCVRVAARRAAADNSAS